jgi:hypothetical protein
MRRRAPSISRSMNWGMPLLERAWKSCVKSAYLYSIVRERGV